MHIRVIVRWYFKHAREKGKKTFLLLVSVFSSLKNLDFHEGINNSSSIEFLPRQPFALNPFARIARDFSRVTSSLSTLPWASFRVDVPRIMPAFIEYLAAGLPAYFLRFRCSSFSFPFNRMQSPLGSRIGLRVGWKRVEDEEQPKFEIINESIDRQGEWKIMRININTCLLLIEQWNCTNMCIKWDDKKGYY